MPLELSTGAPKAPPLSPTEQRNRDRQRTTLISGSIVLFLLFFVALLRFMVFEMTVITSGSMEPTLQVGDYALVDHRVALRNSWQRGDVIVFHEPENWEGANDTLVKRIIGLPGETVRFIDGRVWINDQPLSEPYIKEKPIPEQIPTAQLGPQQYYVIGDNRNNSEDSRDNGPVPEKDITGRVVRIISPFSRSGAIGNPFQ